MKYKNRILLVAIVGLLLLGVTGTTQAQSNRSWNWTRWDVTISNVDTRQNVFHVVETQQITVTEGSFAGGDRSVTLDRVTSVDHVTVAQDGTSLPLSSARSANTCTQNGIFCLLTGNNEIDIYYNFTARTYAGQAHTMTLEYDVHGALRSYKEGDQLWWSPLAGTRDFPVLASRVVVTMPAGLRILPDDNTSSNWTRSVEGSTVTFVARGTIGTNDLAEINVNYTHDPNMAPPPWQAGFDSAVSLRPLISLGLLVLGLLFAIGGPLLIFIYYSTHGRDPHPVVVPEYLTEPPSDMPPGVIGTLVDESADMGDIMATLLDLARRGYIVIEQIEHPGLFSHSLDFIFHRTEPAQAEGATEPPVPLRQYERMFLDGLFRGGSTTRLSELRNRFYRVIPGLKSQLYREVVGAGYFPRSPETTRSTWMFMGIGLAAVAGFLVYLFFSDNGASLRQFSGLFPVPFIGLGFTGIVMIIAGQFMPAKTVLGSQEAAKWHAFKHYLGNIKKYANLEQATDQFEKYIGYAVAFGLDKHWMHEFAPVLTSMPNWYYIDGYSRHRYWERSPMGGHSGGVFSGGGRQASGGGLNEMSSGMTQGLNAMSSGLTSLLNSATSVMTSQPSSSGGGSHGGGGGSSGGGHAGGH